MTSADYVRHAVSQEDLLYQLAEESAELSQAALKLARKLKGTNPTPKTLSECKTALIEEVADVELCMLLCGLLDGVNELRELAIIRAKTDRWAERLRKENRHV